MTASQPRFGHEHQGPRVSYSSLSSFIRCPRSHRYRYVDHLEPTHRPGVLAFGTAIHEALAAFYAALRDGLAAPPPRDLQDVFTESWLREINQPVPVLFDDGQDAESLQTTGQGLLAKFHELAPRPYEVLAVEERFSVDLFDADTGEILPEHLAGVFDAVVQDENGRLHIIEHKTAARKWSEDRLANDLQITAYHFAAAGLGHRDAQVDIQVLLKQKTPALAVYSPSRSARDHLDFLSVATGVVKAIAAGVDYPVRDWHCRSCPYAAHCLVG